MVKTTPPGRGSRLLRPGGPDPVHDLAVDTPCGARLLATGPFDEDDLGVACYHSKTGAVELYLNHLVDGPGEYVVVDCTAGADSFASGLFTRFDLTVLVAEPTRKGISVYRQWQDYAAGYDVALAVAGNKVQGPEDVAFLREHAGDDLLAWFGHEPAVRAMEQGRPFSLDDLSPATSTALGHPPGQAGRAAQGLGQVHPPGRRIPPQERPRLGQRRRRRGPGRPDRPGLHPRAARTRHGADVTTPLTPQYSASLKPRQALETSRQMQPGHVHGSYRAVRKSTHTHAGRLSPGRQSAHLPAATRHRVCRTADPITLIRTAADLGAWLSSQASPARV